MVRYLVLNQSEGLSNNQLERGTALAWNIGGGSWLGVNYSLTLSLPLAITVSFRTSGVSGMVTNGGALRRGSRRVQRSHGCFPLGDRTLDSLERFTNSAKVTLERCGVCVGDGDCIGEQLLDGTLATRREWRRLD
ncbi:hypothetical protein NC651_039890 [Populus alba x Populus x berolinensis]|nr:hypothetical protein NC651_039890 [Populus alba x Populus x berolinensis]